MSLSGISENVKRDWSGRLWIVDTRFASTAASGRAWARASLKAARRRVMRLPASMSLIVDSVM